MTRVRLAPVWPAAALGVGVVSTGTERPLAAARALAHELQNSRDPRCSGHMKRPVSGHAHSCGSASKTRWPQSVQRPSSRTSGNTSPKYSVVFTRTHPLVDAGATSQEFGTNARSDMQHGMNCAMRPGVAV